MKNFWLVMGLLLLMSGCLPKKNSDVEPDLSGTYQISRLVVNTQTFNLPSNGSSASVIVSRRGDAQIDLQLTITENGSTDIESLGTPTIRKASGRDYDILNSSNSRVGSLNGTDFSLDLSGNGQRLSITARK